MDHDSIQSEFYGPVSFRASDIRSSYGWFADKGIRAIAAQARGSPAYSSNDSGHFAWDLSFVMRAACLMWRATGEVHYLEIAYELAMHVSGRTDAELGLRDWRARSRPVWSAGTRYTAGRAVIGECSGQSVVLQAAADAIRVERPSADTVRIAAIRDGQTVWSSPESSVYSDARDYLPDVLAARSSTQLVLLQGLSSPVDLKELQPGDFEVEPLLAPHLVHTGLICRALVSVGDSLAAAKYPGIGCSSVVSDLYSLAERSLVCHDDELRVLSDGSWYVTPYDFPGRRLGMALPHNHVSDVASAFMSIGRRAENADFYDRGVSLAQGFLREISSYSSGSLSTPWHYYPVDSDSYVGVERDYPIAERIARPVMRAEDSSHATMRVRALLDWKTIDDSLVPDSALRSVAETFRRGFFSRVDSVPTIRWLATDSSRGFREGFADSFSGVWALLSPWCNAIRSDVNSLSYRKPPSSIFGATVLSAAEVVAANS